MYIFINCIGIIITTPPAISKAYKNKKTNNKNIPYHIAFFHILLQTHSIYI